MRGRLILLLTMLLMAAPSAFAANCTVTGNVIDNNKEPLPYSMVVLKGITTIGDKMTEADDNGYFCFKGVGEGQYKLSISLVGFVKYESAPFDVPADGSVEFPQIELVSDLNKLSDVVVTAVANVCEVKPTYIKYKTSALVSQAGGTAGDILKNMPSVAMGGSLGHNRDIRFRGLGNAYTKVLVNGRETSLKGNNRESILDQIPAGSINYIEILSIPGADYQSEGLNGVVNIVLKNNHNYGTHGKAEVMAGNYDGLTGGISLSNRGEKLNLFAQYDFQQRTLPKTKDKVKTSLKEGAVTGIEKNWEDEDKSFNNQSLRTGFDYFVLPKTKVTAEYTYGYQFEDNNKTNDITKYDAAGVWKSATQEVKASPKDNSYHQGFGALEHTFGKGAKALIDFNYITSVQDKAEDKTTYAINKIGKWANFQPAMELKKELIEGEEYAWNASLGNVLLGSHNIKAGYAGKFEDKTFHINTYKFNYKDTSWTASSSGFDNFNVTELTQAFYAMDEYKISFMRLKAGLRYENTDIKSNAEAQTDKVNGNYHLFLPNASVTANIDKTQYVTANFGRRIRRPGFKDLNPYEEEKEAGSFKKGNPDLRPELAWAYELGYLKNYDRFNMGVNLFYRDIKDVIQKNLSEDDQGIVTEQPQNTGAAWLAGVELMTNVNPFDWWELNASYSLFESKITSGDYEGDALTDQYKWSAKAINDFKLPFATSFQTAVNVVGPKVSGQKKENTIWCADMGIEKKIYTNGALVLRVTDVFDSLVKDKTEYTDASTTVESEKSVGRIFFIGVNWKF